MLVQRLPIYLRRIAGVLAVMNGEHEISVGALEAAFAWVDYAAATIDAIAATAADRKKTHALTSDGEVVLAALTDLGGDRTPVSTRDILRKTRMDKTRLDAAITYAAADGTIANRPHRRGLCLRERDETTARDALPDDSSVLSNRDLIEEDPF